MGQLGTIIKFRRKKAGLSQKTLADLAGVGKTVIFDMEKGKETVPFKSILLVLNVLNIQLAYKSPLYLTTDKFPCRNFSWCFGITGTPGYPTRKVDSFIRRSRSFYPLSFWRYPAGRAFRSKSSPPPLTHLFHFSFLLCKGGALRAFHCNP